MIKLRERDKDIDDMIDMNRAAWALHSPTLLYFSTLNIRNDNSKQYIYRPAIHIERYLSATPPIALSVELLQE